jgi:hypothetical protein
MKRSRLPCSVAALVAASWLAAPAAHALPTLQLYIDGATYDPATETWITEDATFDLWVIGNVAGPGGTGAITNVALAAAFVTGEVGTITLTPTTTGVVTDPSIPVPLVFNGASADGARPMLNDGSLLPTHGVYGAGVSFFEWELGDLSATDSPTGDFIGSFPGTLFADTGQINVYEVSVTGFPSGIHFDVYNTVVGETHSSFGPFSHDAGVVPEPGATLLFGVGCLVAGVAAQRRRARR